MVDIIRFKRDALENWQSVDPVLLEGELGIDTDTRGIRIGDGITPWNQIPDVGGDSSNHICNIDCGDSSVMMVAYVYDGGNSAS